MSMTLTLTDVFKPEELRDARTVVYIDELRTLKVCSKRAPSPVERVVLAERERRLRLEFEELLAAGLVNPLPEGLAA